MMLKAHPIIILRVEDVENEDHDCHDKVESETNEVTESIAASHMLIDLLESFVHFLFSHTCNLSPNIYALGKERCQ